MPFVSDEPIDAPAVASGAGGIRPALLRWPAGLRLGLGLVGVALLALVWLAAPLLLWAYDIERAGALMDVGMRWPDQRDVSSLPQLRDRQALEQALLYLDSAMRRRPAHAHAYRLSGHVYA